jgi:hypothetical protein
MINPVSSHVPPVSLDTSTNPVATAQSAPKPVAPNAVTSTLNERQEPVAEETKETAAQKAQEAMKTLANSETKQLPLSAPNQGTSPTLVQALYEGASKSG